MGFGSFTQDLGNGFYKDPRTGQILDSTNGATFNGEQELMTYASNPQGTMEQGYRASQVPSTGALGGGVGAAGAGYGLYSLGEGGTVAGEAPALMAPATPTIVEATSGTGAAPATAAAPMSGLATAGLGAGAALGTIAGHEAADKFGVGKPYAALNALNPMEAAYSVSKDIGGLSHGGNLSGMSSIAAAPFTAGASLLYNPIASMFGGKGKDQRARDSYRGGIKENAAGFFDPGDHNNNVTLSSGASLDWGKDGGSKLLSMGGKSRGYYDVDFNNPGSGDLVAYLDPLGAIFGRGKRKGTSDMTGYLVNTAQSTGDAISNAKELYQRAGLDYGTARDLVNQLDTDQAHKDAYFNSLDHLFGQNAYAGKPASAAQKPAAKPVTNSAAPALGSTISNFLANKGNNAAKPVTSKPGSSINLKSRPVKVWR